MTSQDFRDLSKAGVNAGLTFREWVAFMDAYCARMWRDKEDSICTG